MNDTLTRFENAMNDLERKAVLLWNNVKTITLDAVVSKEIDLVGLSKRCDALSDINHRITMGLYSELEKIPEDEYYGTSVEDRHSRLESRSSRVGKILNVIEATINGFDRMIEEIEEAEERSGLRFLRLDSETSLSQEE